MEVESLFVSLYSGMYVWRTYSFHEAGSYAGYCSFYFLVAVGAHDEGAAGVDGREERVAVFYAVLELVAEGYCFLGYPLEFAVLKGLLIVVGRMGMGETDERFGGLYL